MVTITPITFEDLAQLAALYEDLTGKITNLTLLERNFTKISGNEDYLLLGAKNQEGLLVGSVLGIICTDFVGECRPFMVLENMIVSSVSRGQGVGKKLVSNLEEWAASKSCDYIMLVSAESRKGAHAFYEAVGYKKGVVQGFKKFI